MTSATVASKKLDNVLRVARRLPLSQKLRSTRMVYFYETAVIYLRSNDQIKLYFYKTTIEQGTRTFHLVFQQ